jgi:hypothetical protein
LSVSKSTWTSASHSGQVPVGTFYSSPAIGEGRAIPPVGRAPLPSKQPNQSTRERWNLQYSFLQIIGPSFITFLCRKFVYCRLPISDCRLRTSRQSQFLKLKIGNKRLWLPTSNGTGLT